MHNLDSDFRLTGIAFFDVHMFVTSITCLRDYFVVGDVAKSVVFLRFLVCLSHDAASLCADHSFQVNPPSVTLLSKSDESLQVYSTEFLVSESAVNLLVSDSNRNLHMFAYAPESASSFFRQCVLGPRLS